MNMLWRAAGVAIMVSALAGMATAGPKNGKHKAYFAAEAFMNTAPIVTAPVRRFVINPHGEVDGLILNDGTLVKFPPHMQGELTAAVQPGDAVSVRGYREYEMTVKAYVITNESRKLSVVERPKTPDWGKKMPKHLRFATLTRMQVSGKVERHLRGKKGEVNGVILDEGTVVRFPGHAAYGFAAVLQTGQSMAADGLGTQNAYGKAIEALAIGSSPQALQPLYGQPPAR